MHHLITSASSPRQRRQIARPSLLLVSPSAANRDFQRRQALSLWLEASIISSSLAAIRRLKFGIGLCSTAAHGTLSARSYGGLPISFDDDARRGTGWRRQNAACALGSRPNGGPAICWYPGALDASRRLFAPLCASCPSNHLKIAASCSADAPTRRAQCRTL
jgi:hypothetical protein